ncbi:MAG: enoyl-CoA hydratase/isomerase family protein [Rubrivivax sp.]|nr:enoyl-CoA hydratase/isomerase family protein [Rubrivivax sp.]
MPQSLGDYETITLSIDEGLARLTLNRPETLNAVTDTMLVEIARAVAQAAEAGAGALLLTGAGRGFCSGADLGGGLDWPTGVSPAQRADPNRPIMDKVIAAARALHEAPMPVICAINGVAAGGGVGLALAGDVVLMSASARLVLTFVPKLGLVPDFGSIWQMSRLSGRATTLGACLLGEPISAQDAERWGLVYKVIDDATFSDTVDAIARRLAAAPIGAVQGTRRLVDAGPSMSFAGYTALEHDLQLKLMGGPDFVEGRTAFREKRAPRFGSQ